MATHGSFSRYHTSAGVEGRYQPGSRGRVLANRANISSKRRMDRAEYEALLAAQEKYVSIITTGAVFTAALICSMHRDWLGRLYVWAAATAPWK